MVRICLGRVPTDRLIDLARLICLPACKLRTHSRPDCIGQASGLVGRNLDIVPLMTDQYAW